MTSPIYSTIDRIATTLVRDHLPSLRRFMLAVDIGEVICDEHQPSPGTTPECLLRYAEYWAWGATPGHARKLINYYPLPAALQDLINTIYVDVDWTAIRLIPDEMKTEAVCIEALNRSGRSFHDVYKLTPVESKTNKFLKALIGHSKYGFAFIEHELLTESICVAAVENDWIAFMEIPPSMLTTKICLAVLSKNPSILEVLSSSENLEERRSRFLSLVGSEPA